MKRVGIGIMTLMLGVFLLAGCGKAASSSKNVQPEKMVVAVKAQAKSNKDSKSNKNGSKERKSTKKDEYDYGKPVPKCKQVKLSYFSDALFIGDSRTVGFVQSVKMPGARTYSKVGNAVNTTLSMTVKAKDGQQKLMLNALKDESYKKVYLNFGLNETGWAYKKKFVEAYVRLIKNVKKYQPDAVIYVQSIYPVSKKVSDNHDYMTNKRIREYNKALQKMAKKQKVYFVDVAAAVKNKNGDLPSKAAKDGVHVRKKYCQKMLRYLRRHAVKK